jgi:hypothetical protein
MLRHRLGERPINELGQKLTGLSIFDAAIVVVFN